MQIDITFKKDHIRLPISTCSTIQGLLYRAIKEDIVYSTKLHDVGHSYKNRKFKFFTFSELRGQYEIDGHHIIFLSEAHLSVRSMDSYFIQLLFSFFSKNHFIDLADNHVEITDIRLSDEHIYDNVITIRTLSPITVYLTDEKGHTLYHTPNDESFYKSIIQNARHKWCSYFDNDDEFSLEITPLEKARFKKCATRFKDTFITAWHGSFTLKAPAKVLDFLYQTGIGSKNSQGFGMFEILKY